MLKKICLVVCVFFLTGCSLVDRLSDDDLKEYSNKYEKSLLEMCNSYDLSDAKISFGDTFYKDYKNRIMLSMYVLVVRTF